MKLKTGIEIVMGKPGSGKSTYGAYMAKKYLQAGYPVWSNVEIKGTRRLDLSKDLMKHDISDGLVIIDEAGLEMDSRDFKKFPKEYTEFFKLHRHYRLRIIVLTQYWDDVDKKVRVLCNRIQIIRKSMFNLTHIHLKDVTPNITIDKETEQIVERYNWKPIWLGGNHYFNKRSVWSMFDTYERRELAKKDWQLWSEYNPKSIWYKLYHLPQTMLGIGNKIREKISSSSGTQSRTDSPREQNVIE